MEQATEILVFITSSVLVLFLLLSIFLVIQVLLVIRHVRRLAARAETVADSVESIGVAFSEAAKSRKTLKTLEKLMSTLVKNRK